MLQDAGGQKSNDANGKKARWRDAPAQRGPDPPRTSKDRAAKQLAVPNRNQRKRELRDAAAAIVAKAASAPAVGKKRKGKAGRLEASTVEEPAKKKKTNKIRAGKEAAAQITIANASCYRLEGSRPLGTALWDMRQLPADCAASFREAAYSVAKLPPSSPVREAALVRATEALAKMFEATCASTLGGRKWFAHFEQWLWSRRAAEATGATVAVAAVMPVLPTGMCARCDPELERKLARAGCSGGEARRSCAALAERSEALLQEAELASGRVAVSTEHVDGVEGPMVRLTCSQVAVECSEAHFAKLRALYNLHTPTLVGSQAPAPSRRERGGRKGACCAGSVTSRASDGSSEAFVAAAFCALARLHALQGASSKAGGMQAAVHGEVFDALHEDFGCAAEMFASPINCRWAHFCSASADVDLSFGSLGSFFGFRPARGSFQANPPFDVLAVSAMRAHMETLLRAAEASREPLCFVVIIPTWSEKACWKALKGSRFCRATLELPQAEHGYCQGGQHYRRKRHQQANHDSSVFFLQSSAAAQVWPTTPAKLCRLRAAFAAKV